MLFIIVFIVIVHKVLCVSDIFHVNSKVTFYPDIASEYFGYTVVLGNSSMIVGAPKATSRIKKTIAPGAVFSCRLSSLDTANVTCYPLGMDNDGHDKSIRRVVTVRDFFRDDMWFGATIGIVPNGKLMVCAPRWADPYKGNHLLANGACYFETKKRGITLTPLKNQYNAAFKTDGMRKEYGEYGTNLNFYAYGQVGMSMKVTENNSIIIGAPGLLQWTGGVIDYRFIQDPNSVFFNKQQITNPYFTKDLGPDDYFGYSVESGRFVKNGQILYVAGAPRSKMGYGQVLIFEPADQERASLKIQAKVRGSQLGSYFGAALSCADINGDGRSDLLVGAPNFVRKDGGLPYDQGAVFVYLANEDDSGFTLKEAGYVSGSGESGARFGSTIADLGDVDHDGFKDIAVGAPWENSGSGVVYIYKGSSKGLKSQYVQKIIAETARSFGFSISKGLDVDGNNCNDLAIGAHGSNTVYLYRCIPTIQMHVTIKVPDAMNLPQNATNFTALFCVQFPPKDSWPRVKIDLIATITVDPEENRAVISGDSEYTITARPGNDICDQQVVEVKSTADLSKPISIKFDLKPKAPLTDDYATFLNDAARLSEDSTLHASFLIQLVRDCGEDMICTPWLVMTLETFDPVYVPGTKDRLGFRVTVLNKEEPAYGAKVNLKLPLPPQRVPVECTLEGLNMTCEIPAPLERGESVEWEIELEYAKTKAEKMLIIVAELDDPLYNRNITEEALKNVSITVQPKANFSINGKTLPNATLTVTREKYYGGENVSFIHSFEVTNFGPSDWPLLEVVIELPDNVTLSNPVKGCEEKGLSLECSWPIAAKMSLPVELQLRYDLSKYGKLLEEKIYNGTTIFVIVSEGHKMMSTVSTVLVLDPTVSIWPYVVGSISGCLLLAAIVYGLYKYGFFSRIRLDDRKRLHESISDEEPSASLVSTDNEPKEVDESLELISDISD